MTTENEKVEIAIIGGTGVYDPGLLSDVKTLKLYTPFGATSCLITVGNYAGVRVAFLPRHGVHHTHLPHAVPYRANIWALKNLGVKRIIAPAAVGSLRKDMEPGHLVIVDQFIDFTKGRPTSFYEGGEVCHVSMAEPFCPELRKIAIDSARKIGARFHDKGTNITIQGPRFSTKAESHFFKDVMRADVIGMTLVPECTLAREAEICYLCLASVTDYDAWHEVPVDNAQVKVAMKKNLEVIRHLLLEMLPKISKERNCCECGQALQNAIM